MSMASTSNQVTSSCFPSSSSTPHWNHHVFLSFRGTDTRNNFTSHLYTALKQAGIKTFIDDEELPTGKEIKPELRKAIRESRMSIIVFSKNYASSRWCLDELMEILECKRTMGQLVLPLFYDVEPSVVRHQTGSYAEAFQHFDDESDKPKVKNWRAALKEAADLSGHVLADGNEARFIEKIVGKVQPEVNLRFLNVPDSLIRLDSNFNCINTLLSIGSDDVRIIGIYGMGGIGKTTVSKDIYNKHLNHFEGSAFVENIKDVSKLPDGLRRLQKDLLSQLQKRKSIKPSNSDEGINWIKNICCSRRVLILLDDLDHLNQINQLAGQKSWFNTGSRIIMVTRDAKLLKEARIDHTYEMNVLDEDASLELFRRHAFGEGIPFPSEDHKSLSIETTTYCGGLPLALEVIGRHMYGFTLWKWKIALEEFRKYPEKTILDRLKISYDALSKHGKKIFLDVACIFIGWDKDYLVKFWNGCEFSPENSITELLNKCLLKVDEKNCLTMHDHLRDMGRAIVLEASDRSLEKHSRVWIHEEVRDLLEHPKGAEAVEGISFDLSNLQSIALETKAFEAMHQLRFLLMYNVDVIGSFEHLFGKLRWLTWQYCPLKSLPTDFHPRKLVGLDLKSSEIEKLWEGVKHLNNLKILNLSYSESLMETPNFTGVRNLERLMLRVCKRLSMIDPSICELRSLEELDLEGCSMLERLPEELGNMKSLKALNVGDTLLEGLPDSIGQLSRLVHLRLKWCKQLRTLPTTICNLISLEELDVRGCSKLERLPDELGNLECLLVLDISDCWSLTNLPASTCNLSSLEELNMVYCSKMKRLPEEMGNLKRLRTLNASQTGLEELPDSIGHLSSLSHLQLSGCRNLRSLPDCVCDLSSLEVLNIYGCSLLQQLPDRLGNMVSLRNLDAFNIGCPQLPDSIKNLKKLEKLSLGFRDRDPQFAFKKVLLPFQSCSLRFLSLLNCGLCEEDIPNDIVISLHSLQSLDLSQNDFCNLPSTLCQLSNLTDLYLNDCKNLGSLLELPPNLQKLNVRACTAMEKIPNLSNLKRLRDLDLSDSNRLVEVQGIDNLKLRFLDLAGCNDLAMNPTFNQSFFQVSLNLPLSIYIYISSSKSPSQILGSMLQQRYFNRADYDEYSNISLPKWKFQNWIIYQSMKSTISFELPRILPNNFHGIILWVVYARYSTYMTYIANITNNTNGEEWQHFRSSKYFMSDINCLGGHSWVSCIKSNFGSGDSIKISISEYFNVKVEKCGVHWLIGSEGDEDENVH